MTTTTTVSVIIEDQLIDLMMRRLPHHYREYLAKLKTKEEKIEYCHQYLDSIRITQKMREEELEQREKERSERWDIPRNIDIKQYGFSSFEEANKAWYNETYDGNWGPDTNVKAWLIERRKSFLIKEKKEIEKKKLRDLCDLHVRSQEMAKWQMEREEDRKVREKKCANRKSFFKWIK